MSKLRDHLRKTCATTAAGELCESCGVSAELLSELDDLERFAALGMSIVERPQDAEILAPIARALGKLHVTSIDDVLNVEEQIGKARQAVATAWIRTKADVISSSTIEHIGLAVYRLSCAMRRMEKP